MTGALLGEEGADAGARTPVNSFAWGFVSQGASSATNFGLSLLAGWKLGPVGLGEVFVGFTCYIVALGLQRSLISEPLVASSSAQSPKERLTATRAALTLSLVVAVLVASVVGVSGLLLGPGVGHTLVLFAPWIVPALVQDTWRMILFRDRRARSGATNDLAWFMAMAFAFPLALSIGAPWAIVGCWGVGALAGMLAGFLQTRLLPVRLGRAIDWWREHGAHLARWLAAESVVYSLGLQGVVLVLVLLLGPGPIGGLRAVESIFAPLSLLIPALALPALPELSRRVVHAPREARRLARGITFYTTLLTCLYFLVGSLNSGDLLPRIFGESFTPFRSLILPVGLRQVSAALTQGSYLLLKAERRGRPILFSRIIEAVGVLSLASVLGLLFGIEGATWGIAAGYALRMLFLLAVSIARPGMDRPLVVSSEAGLADGNISDLRQRSAQ
jgi:O-antigen/teichoic acid export membrane protein